MKTILVPVDPTSAYEDFLKYVSYLSSKLKGTIFLLKESISETDDKKFKNLVSKLFGENEIHGIEWIWSKGKISNSVIRDHAQKFETDLVILSTDKEGLIKTYFGSHVSELIDLVSCPVLAVPYSCKDYQIERIGFATELYDIKRRIKEVIPLARLFNATIEAFHVYPEFPQAVDVYKLNVKQLLRNLKERNGYENICLHFIRTAFDNEPVKGIREFINVYKPDLLVMYHKPKGLFDKILIGSGTTPSVVDKIHVPILAFSKQKDKVRVL